MAKNIIIDFLQDPLTHMDLVVTNPATSVSAGQDQPGLVPASGTAVSINGIPGVADSVVSADTSWTPVVTSCVAEFLVNGIGPGGQNQAINAQATIYLQANGTLDANNLGVGAIPFGSAFGNSLLNPTGTTPNLGTDIRNGQLVASGSTTTFIRVWVAKIAATAIGPKTMMVARLLYNFAVDGGASVTPAVADWLPANAVVYGGVVNSTTALTAAGSATFAIGTTAGSSATSVLAATAKATLGLDAVVVPTCVATPFKMSAVGQLTIAVATGPLTAGVVEAWVLYFIATNA